MSDLKFFKKVGLTLVLRTIGALVLFLINVIIGRSLGASDAGLYFMALSLVAITAVVARLGLESTVLRFVASEAHPEKWGHARSVLRHALIWSGTVSTIFSFAIVVGAPLIARWLFDDLALTPILVAIGFSVLSLNVMTLASSALNGLGRLRESMLVSSVFYPILTLALLLPSIWLIGPAGAGFAYCCGTTIAAGLGLGLWRRALVKHTKPTPVDCRNFWASALPLWVSTIIIAGVQPWAPLFLLGIWADSTAAGVFGVTTRIVLLVSFLLISINTILAPRYAVLYQQGDLLTISRLAQKSAMYVTIAGSPIFFGLIFARDWVMELFGPDFANSGNVLAILVVGQAINGITGPVSNLLIMTGNERDVRNITIFSGLTILILSIFLIPSMGVTGAAIANAVAITAISVLAAIMVRVRLGFWVIPFVWSTSR